LRMEFIVSPTKIFQGTVYIMLFLVLWFHCGLV
jgi:hypothetical protein